MTAKRGHGEGGIRKRQDGRWEGSIDLGWVSGKRRRKFVYGRTRQEVQTKLSRAQMAIRNGLPASDDRITVKVLCDEWLEVQRAGDKSPNTIDIYEWATGHILQAVGHLRAAALQPSDVDNVLRGMADARHARSSVARVRSVLGRVLRRAEQRGQVVRNVALLADMPRCRPSAPRRGLPPAEVRALLDAARGDRAETLIATALMVGLRPGEATGLLWNDLDLEVGTLTVSGSMKTERGTLRRGDVKKATAARRKVALPPELVVRLRDHRRRQATERLAAGPAWEDHGLVFCAGGGRPLDPANLRRSVRDIAERAGLGRLVPYELRHSAASLLIDDGATVEEVADLLGDSPRTIYRHYRHRTRDTVDVAARRMGRLLADEEGHTSAI